MTAMPGRDLLRTFLHGDGPRGRALRASAFTVLASQGGNLLRLASNLVLTRLLVPEAFGLMAIVQVFLTGLQLVSDMGLGGSVIQNPRGDERRFLDTVWTLQIGRGVLLWAAASALAVPAAALYGEPLLARLMPVAALSFVIQGLRTTNALSAARHMTLGRLTVLALASQALGLVVMAALAFWLRSVWALALGTLAAAAIGVAADRAFLPGPRNRLRVEREAARELVRFGKYIFLTSTAAFVIQRSDRALLGAYLPLDVFGVYSIGWTLAELVSTTATRLADRVLFPLYRTRHPLDGAGFRRAVFRARRLLVGGMLAANALLAFLGVWLAGVLFDPRYALAGPVVVVVTAALVPSVVTAGTTRAALARGDSRSFFVVVTATAALQVALILLGLDAFGVLGAVAAVGAAPLMTYPLLARVARRYASWDPAADAAFLALALAAHGAACWVHRDAVAALARVGPG